MNNTEDQIERREITNPFDFLETKSDSNILDLEHQTTQKTEIVPDILEDDRGGQEESHIDSNLEPIVDEVTPDDSQDPNDQNNPNEGDEDDVDSSEDDYDVEVKGNLAKYAAEALKAQGGLPDDFEVTDDITEADLDKAYVDYKEETLKNQLITEVKKQLAEDEGLSPEMIEEVKLRHYGVQDPEIQKLQALKILSTYNFDESSDNFEDDVKGFLTSYYQLKGFSDNKTNKLVQSDLEDEELLTTISDAQKDLGNDFVQLDTDIKSKVQESQKRREDARKESVTKINNFLSQDKFAGRSKDELEIVRKALFDKTEIVTGPDGKRYRTTLYYKRRMEASQDLEKDLQHKIDFILGGDSTTLKNKEREKTTKKLMRGLNDHISVDVKKSSRSKRSTSAQISNKNDQGIQRVEIN